VRHRAAKASPRRAALGDTLPAGLRLVLDDDRPPIDRGRGASLTSMRALLLIPLIACSSRPAPTPDAAEPHYAPTTPGAAIVTPYVEKLTLQSHDISGVGGPPGECNPRENTYTITMSDHHLVWNLCEPSGHTHTTPRAGERTIDDASWQILAADFPTIVVSDAAACARAAYYEETSLVVTNNTGDQAYGDDDACSVYVQPLVKDYPLMQLWQHVHTLTNGQ
jgi:hypothetical protein